jgi:hypothetical protein
MITMRDTLDVLLVADLDAADRDAVAGYVKRSRELRSWLDSFDVRCVRRTNTLAEQGRSEPADSMMTHEGSQSSRSVRQGRQRAEVCELFALFERALTAGEIVAGHVDALAMAIRDLDADQRFDLIDREEKLLLTARRMRVDDFVRHCRSQAADVVAQRAQAARTAALAASAESIDDSGSVDGAGADGDDAVGAPSAPPVVPLVDPAVVEYERQRAASKMRRWRDDESGMCMTLIALDPIRDAMLKKAYDGHLNARRAAGATNGLPWRQVEVDAILHAITSGVGGAETRHPSVGSPGSIGSASPVTSGDLNRLRTEVNREVEVTCPDASTNVPEICVVTTLDRVLDDCRNHGLCETSDGQPVAPASLRRMLCDAAVYPVVLGGDGEVLDAGRTRRTVTPEQRRALRAMHRTCGKPGCTVPFDSCRIHHVRWWVRDKGPTDIENLIPVCECDHHLVHEGGWILTMTPDRVATWIRPDGTHWKTANTADRAADILAESGDLSRTVGVAAPRKQQLSAGA